MRKLVSVISILSLALVVITGCAAQEGKTAEGSQATQKLIVGASPEPHAEILKVAKEVFEEKGYELEIKEFTDYVQPNLTLQSKQLDANYFQHLPYLEDFNVQNKTDLVSIAAIHYEPLGLYPGKTKSLDDLQDGAVIAVPNDTTNEARALLLLETIGLIKINPEAGLTATAYDIIENPKNLQIRELEAAQISRALTDVDLAVINGNYAIQAGLNVAQDALAKEEKDSLAAQTFANILAIKKGDENREAIVALVEALKSDKVKAFIEEKYQGNVIALF